MKKLLSSLLLSFLIAVLTTPVGSAPAQWKSWERSLMLKRLNRRSPGASSFVDASRCEGIHVNPGDNILGKVNNASPGSKVCIHAGTYDLKSRTLLPKDEVTLRGDPVTVGSKGEVHAPTKVYSTAKDGVIKATIRGQQLRILNLDVSGATGTKSSVPATKQHGRGLNGNGRQPVVSISYSRFHHNANSGIGGIGAGSVLHHLQLDHNGSDSYVGCCASGVKAGRAFTIRKSYVHNNIGNGIWCDVGCEGGTFRVKNNLVSRNTRDGVRDEWSDHDGRSSIIRNNTVRGNNTDGARGGHGGITAVSVWHVLIEGNVLRNNGNAAIQAKDDKRGSLRDVVIRDNDLGGGPLKGCGNNGCTCIGNG